MLRRPAVESELLTAPLPWPLDPWDGPEHPPQGAPEAAWPRLHFYCRWPQLVSVACNPRTRLINLEYLLGFTLSDRWAECASKCYRAGAAYEHLRTWSCWSGHWGWPATARAASFHSGEEGGEGREGKPNRIQRARREPRGRIRRQLSPGVGWGLLLAFWVEQSLVGLSRWLSDKESTCQCRRHRRQGFDPWVGKIPLEKGMATHSSFLAWEISQTEEPGRLQSMGSQRVGHNWTTQHKHDVFWNACLRLT